MATVMRWSCDEVSLYQMKLLLRQVIGRKHFHTQADDNRIKNATIKQWGEVPGADMNYCYD